LGRNRKRSNQQLPPMVYINRNRYIFVERIDGVRQKAIKLGRSDISLTTLWSIYRDITETSSDTLEYLVARYTDSLEFKAKPTCREMLRALTVLLNTPSDGSVFGKVKYRDITPGTIRKYLDYRNNVAGNRDITYLSSAWAYCYERDIVRITNPCKGVKRIPESARTRYVTDDEYRIVYEMPELKYLKVAMD